MEQNWKMVNKEKYDVEVDGSFKYIGKNIKGKELE